jgi:hypothetical protein
MIYNLTTTQEELLFSHNIHQSKSVNHPIKTPEVHANEANAYSVVEWVSWIGEIKDDRTCLLLALVKVWVIVDLRVRAGTTTALGEDVVEVNLAIKAEATVWQDVDPVSLVVTR